MCGISGILLKDCSHISNDIVQINNRVKHRGPDDEGYVLINSQNAHPFAGNDTPKETLYNQSLYCPKDHISNARDNYFLALGHRRLSIIDISANGHQPMCTKNKQVWITLNGEIYNYIELKKELQGFGYQFYTESDTEVVLTSYEHWGKACVHHFNGMWAFVIYDALNNILFGSRDRLGVKPLYYSMGSDFFVFASEQKALWQSRLLNSGLNSRAVFDYLALSHSEPETEGFFKNIFAVKQGHNFILDIPNFKHSEYQYYSPFQVKGDNKISYEDGVKHLHTLLVNAVNIRTRADVEIGSCLSGGIDSSIIVILLNNYFKEKQTGYMPKVFTAVYPNYKIDEEHWAKHVVDATSVNWFKTSPSGKDLVSDLADLIYAADSPILTTSTYSQYRVMKLASEQGVKVLLDGQGADELFAGYDVFYPVFFNELLVRFKIILLFKELKASGKFSSQLKKWVITDIQMMLKRMPAPLSKILYEAAISELKYLKPEFKHEFLYRFGEVTFPFGLNLNTTLKNYAFGEKLQVMLRLEDRMSMHFSVESRTPFSDDTALLDFAMNLPAIFKIKNGVRKYILRDASKNILPKQILHRTDKIGFQTPEFDWLSSLTAEIPNLIESNINQFVDTQLIKKNLTSIISNPTSHESSRLLRFVFFSQWKKIYKL
jgi:asparagine synthase (glutamine-hydrolysing)